MAASPGKMPVYMRVGDGPECEIGALVPEAGDMVIAPDGTVKVLGGRMMAALLHAAADRFEAQDGQPDTVT